MKSFPSVILTLSNAFLFQGCGGDSEPNGSNPTDPNGNNSTVALTPKTAPAPKGVVISKIEDSGVEVTFSLATGEGGKRWLQANFAPTEEGYHVYSKDLPPDGIDGIGRPTLLELSKHEAISYIGKLTADKKVHNLASPLNADGFPVYPNGPVTLTLPFFLKAEENATIEITAKVTYMACTKTNCKAPVEGKEVKLTLR